MTPDEALLALKEGNRRFMEGDPVHRELSDAQRQAMVSDGQSPYAAVLACSATPFQVFCASSPVRVVSGPWSVRTSFWSAE